MLYIYETLSARRAASFNDRGRYAASNFRATKVALLPDGRAVSPIAPAGAVLTRVDDTTDAMVDVRTPDYGQELGPGQRRIWCKSSGAAAVGVRIGYNNAGLDFNALCVGVLHADWAKCTAYDGIKYLTPGGEK